MSIQIIKLWPISGSQETKQVKERLSDVFFHNLFYETLSLLPVVATRRGKTKSLKRADKKILLDDKMFLLLFVHA